MKEVFILLGSNRGDREGYISRAIEMIGIEAGEVCRRSALYETEPYGFKDPIRFLNQVVEIDAKVEPEDLLEKLLSIETKLGRVRPVDGCGCGIAISQASEKGFGSGAARVYSGRTIDLDILFYGQRLVFTDCLMIPHPRLHERRFALVPMNEIAPEFIHPLLKKSISVLLNTATDQTRELDYI